MMSIIDSREGVGDGSWGVALFKLAGTNDAFVVLEGVASDGVSRILMRAWFEQLPESPGEGQVKYEPCSLSTLQDVTQGYTCKLWCIHPEEKDPLIDRILADRGKQMYYAITLPKRFSLMPDLGKSDMPEYSSSVTSYTPFSWAEKIVRSVGSINHVYAISTFDPVKLNKVELKKEGFVENKSPLAVASLVLSILSAVAGVACLVAMPGMAFVALSLGLILAGVVGTYFAATHMYTMHYCPPPTLLVAPEIPAKPKSGHLSSLDNSIFGNDTQQPQLQ